MNIKPFDVYVDAGKVNRDESGRIEIKSIKTLDFPCFRIKQKRIMESRKQDGNLTFYSTTGELIRKEHKR